MMKAIINEEERKIEPKTIRSYLQQHLLEFIALDVPAVASHYDKYS